MKHLICAVGRGSIAQGKTLAQQLHQLGLGEVVLSDKYLCNLLDFDCANTSVVRQRVLKISEAYYSLIGLWKKPGSPVSHKEAGRSNHLLRGCIFRDLKWWHLRLGKLY